MKCFVHSTKIDTRYDEVLIKASGNDDYGPSDVTVMASGNSTLYIYVQYRGDISEFNRIIWPRLPDPDKIASLLENLVRIDGDVFLQLQGYREKWERRVFKTVCALDDKQNDIKNRYIPSTEDEQNLTASAYNKLRSDYDMSVWLEKDRQRYNLNKDNQYWYRRDLGFEVDYDIPGVDYMSRPGSPYYLSGPALTCVPLDQYDSYFEKGDRSVLTQIEIMLAKDCRIDTTRLYLRSEVTGTLLAEYTVEVICTPVLLVGFAYQSAEVTDLDITQAIFTKDTTKFFELRDAVIRSVYQFERV